MDYLVIAVLSFCCLCVTAAPQASLPWQKLSVAAPVYRNTDDILRFEPSRSFKEVWEAFKAEHGTAFAYYYLPFIFIIISTDALITVTFF